jgi:hypothetical protein
VVGGLYNRRGVVTGIPGSTTFATITVEFSGALPADDTNRAFEITFTGSYYLA